MANKRSASGPSYLRILLSLVLVVGILYLAKPIIVPLALAVLLTFVLTPIVSAIQHRGLGRIPAVLVTVILTFSLFGAVGWGVGMQVNKLARELPKKKEQIQQKIADLRGSEDGVFGKLVQMVREIGAEPGKTDAAADQNPANANDFPPIEKQIVVARPEEASTFDRLLQTVSPVLEPLATAGLVVILVVFMLIKREDLRNRLIGVLGHGQLTGTTRILVDTARRLSSFLLTQVLINVSFGIVFGVGLMVIGVPYAFLWGFLTAVLRFIPYIGTWISVAFPLILSFAVSDGWYQPVAVLVFFAVLDLTTANVLEPLLFGHSTGVTPIALLIAAAFWSWIWGPIGLVLSTPLTVCLVVLGQHVPRLNFFSLLLGDQAALAPHASFYQRLLAKDQAEATQVVAEFARASGPEHVYDDVLLPALVLARRDRLKAGLTGEDEGFVFQATREVLAELEKAPTPTPAAEGQTAELVATAPTEPASPVLVLGFPAHHEAEELSLHMLELLLKPTGCRVEVLTTRALSAEVEARVEQEKPALVFLAVLPPGGLVQARFLCKRLRARFADLPIVVGYWGTSRYFDKLLMRLRSAGASYVTTSLLQSRSQILALVNPPAPEPPAPVASL
jgi:predicted PurR-regulated permease PerM